MTKLFSLAASIPWAIEAPWLKTILAIANREGRGPEAVSAELGRPLANSQSVEMRDGVAVISLIGPIFPRANAFTQISGATSVSIAARDLYTALQDPSVSAILLNIDSPGGDVTGISEFADMVRSARSSKPVHAYVGGVGASAAYWIASAAESITIDKTARVGSIGVVMSMPNPGAETAKDIEIVSSQSPDKRVDPTTDEGRAAIQKTVDALADVFVGAVAANRGVSAERVISDFGRGGVLVGKQAVAAGMADSIGSFEGTIASLRQRAAKTGTQKMSIASALGLNAEATEQEIESAVAALKSDRDELLAACGVSTTIHAVGVIESARAGAARVPGLETEVAQLRASADETERQALIASLCAENKLTDKTKRMASMLTLSQLKEFAAHPDTKSDFRSTPDVEEKTESNAVVAKHNGKTWDEMTADELAKLHSENPALYEALRADNARTSGH